MTINLASTPAKGEATKSGGSIDTAVLIEDPASSDVSYPDLEEGKRQPVQLDWGRVLAENEGWLRTVIAARVGEPAAVDEVFQEVSLATIRQQAPLLDADKVSPWLYRLAVTQSLLYRRTMGRKRKLITRYTQKYPIEEYDQKQTEPIDWLLSEERRDCVRRAMSLLPKSQQELLMLKYVHDWSYRDMAERLGITVSAVQAKLHRARGLLRQKLERMQVDYS